MRINVDAKKIEIFLFYSKRSKEKGRSKEKLEKARVTLKSIGQVITALCYICCCSDVVGKEWSSFCPFYPLQRLICHLRSQEQFGWDAATLPPGCSRPIHRYLPGMQVQCPMAAAEPRGTRGALPAAAGPGGGSTARCDSSPGLQGRGVLAPWGLRGSHSRWWWQWGEGKGQVFCPSLSPPNPAPVSRSFFVSLQPGYSQSIPHKVFRCSRVIMKGRHYDEALFEAVFIIRFLQLVLTLTELWPCMSSLCI